LLKDTESGLVANAYYTVFHKVLKPCGVARHMWCDELQIHVRLYQ